jgi:hypothetical protein
MFPVSAGPFYGCRGRSPTTEWKRPRHATDAPASQAPGPAPLDRDPAASQLFWLSPPAPILE